jgi:excisionase family DNA binding protein
MALLTLEELCKELNVKVNRTTAWRWRKSGMPFVNVGKKIRYDKEEVMKWLKK